MLTEPFEKQLPVLLFCFLLFFFTTLGICYQIANENQNMSKMCQEKHKEKLNPFHNKFYRF